MREPLSDRPSFGFDLDGVLMVNPFDSCVVPRLERLLAGAPALAGRAPADASRAVRAAVRRAWQQRMATGDLASAYDWDGVYRDVAAELGLPQPPGAIDVSQWVRECCAPEGRHIRAMPGVAEMLERLAGAGARLVVISNGFAPYQEPVLAALGLLDAFEQVVTPDRTGYAKPDARIFQAAGRLDAFVGDTLVHDVLGARLAGVPPVWVCATLPPDLAVLTPRSRASGQALPALLRASLEASPHTRFHPEGTVEACTPSAVVRDMAEAADLLLEIADGVPLA